MFTFSFGSAFASLPWTGEATSKYLTEENDYTATAAGTVDKTKGTEGITEAYRAELTKEAKAELAHVKGDKNPFYAPEKTEAVAAIEAYIEALKTVKTARDAAKLKADLASKVGAWDGAAITQSATSLPQKTKVLNDAAGANGIAKAAKAGGAAGSAEIDLTRIATRAADKNLYLPGYVMLANGTNFDAIPAASASKLTTETGKNTAGTIFVDADNYKNAADITKKVIDWFMDNDYRETADFAAGSRAFAAALKANDDAYKKTVQDEFDAIQNEIYNYVDKDAATRRGLAISELEGVDALVKKINDFNDKYAGYNKTFTTKDFTDSVIARLADNYFDQYYTEVSAVPEVKKLTDADKATVVALYKKVVALEDSYTAVWKYKTSSAKANAYDFAKLQAAYKHFIEADVKAFKNLTDFDAYTRGGVQNGSILYYFDASEKNVSAMKAQRAAYDALVSNYGYSDLADATLGAYNDAVAAEAKLLAGEHNQGADAAYDVKDTNKLQAYLNNATLKVSTKALGNSKIRVNARFDAETYKDIVAECGNDYTISYKFYQKSAKATSFKGPKEKSRNYITYGKASLKKGTKYKFQCGVVIKDKDGKVVAEKSYEASTTGSRVCR